MELLLIRPNVLKQDNNFHMGHHEFLDTNTKKKYWSQVTCHVSGALCHLAPVRNI